MTTGYQHPNRIWRIGRPETLGGRRPVRHRFKQGVTLGELRPNSRNPHTAYDAYTPDGQRIREGFNAHVCAKALADHHTRTHPGDPT